MMKPWQDWTNNETIVMSNLIMAHQDAHEWLLDKSQDYCVSLSTAELNEILSRVSYKIELSS